MEKLGWDKRGLVEKEGALFLYQDPSRPAPAFRLFSLTESVKQANESKAYYPCLKYQP